MVGLWLLGCRIRWDGAQTMICCDQVRQDWGIRESVGPDRWQAIMRQYLRQDRQEAARLAADMAGPGVATPSGRRKQVEPCAEGDSHHGTCQSWLVCPGHVWFKSRHVDWMKGLAALPVALPGVALLTYNLLEDKEDDPEGKRI